MGYFVLKTFILQLLRPFWFYFHNGFCISLFIKWFELSVAVNILFEQNRKQNHAATNFTSRSRTADKPV